MIIKIWEIISYFFKEIISLNLYELKNPLKKYNLINTKY